MLPPLLRRPADRLARLRRVPVRLVLIWLAPVRRIPARLAPARLTRTWRIPARQTLVRRILLGLCACAVVVAAAFLPVQAVAQGHAGTARTAAAGRHPAGPPVPQPSHGQPSQGQPSQGQASQGQCLQRHRPGHPRHRPGHPQHRPGHPRHRPGHLPAHPHGRGAHRPGPAGWRIYLRLPACGDSPLLASVTADSGSDAWASGAAALPTGNKFRPIVEHWDGSSWQPITLPRRVLGVWRRAFPFSAIGASSGSDFWAFSEVNGTYLHWNGRSWNAGVLPGNSPAGPLVISSVVEFSSTDVEVFGGRLIGTHNAPTDAPYTARFNGHRWRIGPAPAGPSAISAVSALSPADIWAVLGRVPLLDSGSSHQPNAVAHWDGHRWATIRLPAVFAGVAGQPGAPGAASTAAPPTAGASGAGASGAGAAGGVGAAAGPGALAGQASRPGHPAASLTSVVALGPRDIWVGGGLPNARGGLTEAAANWTGARWRVVRLPAHVSAVQYQLISMIPDGRGGAWAIAANAALTRSRLWRLRAGRWAGPILLRPCDHACVLAGLAQVPGTTSVWAAGAVARGTTGDGIIAVYGKIPR